MSNLALIPFFFAIILYLAVLGFTIWFAISLIKAQKERNGVLKEISNKLDNLKFNNEKE